MQKIDKLVSSLYQKQPNQALFHYTSIGNFLNIINNRSLFASEVRYFSDSEEMRHSVKLFQHVINARLESEVTEFQEKLFKQLYK